MNWFRFYSDALEDPKVQRLPGDLFKTWVNLLCLANKSPERGRLPSVDDMAFALRLDVDTLTAQLHELRERGLIDTDDAGDAPHNWNGRQKKSDNVTERVQQHRAQWKQPPPDAPSEDETLHETTAKPPAKRQRNALDTDTEKETDTDTEKDTPPIPPEPTPLRRSPLSVRQQELFDRWWRTYPRREAKAEAQRWWARNKPDPATVDAMVAAVARQLQSGDWQKEGGRFIPQPTKWLNQRRWEDETIGPAPKIPWNHPAAAARAKVYD